MVKPSKFDFLYKILHSQKEDRILPYNGYHSIPPKKYDSLRVHLAFLSALPKNISENRALGIQLRNMTKTARALFSLCGARSIRWHLQSGLPAKNNQNVCFTCKLAWRLDASDMHTGYIIFNPERAPSLSINPLQLLKTCLSM